MNLQNLIKYMNLATTLNTHIVLPLPPAGASTTDPVQESLNELEFLAGNVSRHFGALRANMGYPEPWEIHFVEILSDNGKLEELLVHAVREKYPGMGIFSSSKMEQNRVGRVVKEHVTPDGLMKDFGKFDHPQGPVMVGG